jgi:hypothetical protein
MLKRFAVVAFRTIAAPPPPTRGAAAEQIRVEERGGGVCFVPIEERATWPNLVARLVQVSFRRPLGQTVEVGIASLDEETLATVCRRFGAAYWQGGDS